MVSSVRYVIRAIVNRGSGLMDFVSELKSIRPDYFVVNEDGDTPDKKNLCSNLDIEYVVLKRIPEEGLPARSATSIRNICTIPYRIDLAGGWLDQPYVSKHFPGRVLSVADT